MTPQQQDFHHCQHNTAVVDVLSSRPAGGLPGSEAASVVSVLRLVSTGFPRKTWPSLVALLAGGGSYSSEGGRGEYRPKAKTCLTCW